MEKTVTCGGHGSGRSTGPALGPDMVYDGPNRYEVVTFEEALRRLGMLGKVAEVGPEHLAEHVAYRPDAQSESDGSFSSYCGTSAVLYRFPLVTKGMDGWWMRGAFCVAIAVVRGRPQVRLAIPG